LSQKDSSAIGNADENVLIVGRVGSGKTSGSGSYLALKYLEAGFGAIMSADEAKQSA
jgi:polynucleotide 5'-kinase involved in rRNA processing